MCKNCCLQFVIESDRGNPASTMELVYGILYAVLAIFAVSAWCVRDRMSYWKKRGVPHDRPLFIYGNMKGFRRTKLLFEPVRELYNKYKGSAPFCGFYFFFRPSIIALDLGLIKRILIKDFNSFADRGFFHNERDDPLTGHLFALDGDRWRQLRTKLSPTFTSGKMRFMFPTVVEVGNRFAEVLSEMVGKGEVVEIKEILARFTTDVIGTCAFGIECNSLRDPNAEFRTIGQKFFTTTRHNIFILAFIRSCPDLARTFRLRLITDDVHNFFMRAVRETVEHREKNGIVRNDFMNMLIDLKNKKSTKTENGDVITGLTMEELAAQAFVFFIAGFETSSSTMGFALFELAINQDIQDRLRKEVNEVLARHNGIFTYECMKEMRFMDQVIYETLRKYTLAFALFRQAKADYVVPDSSYKIEKGTLIFIPADAIHHDPEIYPNPELFDPERFSPEGSEDRDPIAWLPFGDGPRNCIGLRFGKLQTLTLLLKNFKFHVCDQTQIPMEFSKRGVVLSSKGGIHLRIEPL